MHRQNQTIAVIPQDTSINDAECRSGSGAKIYAEFILFAVGHSRPIQPVLSAGRCPVCPKSDPRRQWRRTEGALRPAPGPEHGRTGAAHGVSVQKIDTSIVRVHQHGASMIRNRRQSMGRSRGGLTGKIHAVVDTNGLPARLAPTAGEAHGNRLADKLLSRLKSGSMQPADRAYDSDWIRALAARKGALANIPPRCNRGEPICFSPYPYRARNPVERFFNKIKHCRRIATRYDKLAANHLAFIQLASIRLWLSPDEFTPWSASALSTFCASR